MAQVGERSSVEVAELDESHPGRSSDNAAAGADRAGAEPGERSNHRGSGMIDLDFVRGLIEAVDNSGIDSIEITRAGTRIRIGKTPPVAATYAAAPAAGPAPQVTEPPPQSGTVAGTAASEESGEDATSGLTEIKSPMVGTFYRAPAPEAPPYVEVGSRVSQGQTLCILEAMKLMNELESEMDGVVREILVKNAEPVEYGQVLFRIEAT